MSSLTLGKITALGAVSPSPSCAILPRMRLLTAIGQTGRQPAKLAATLPLFRLQSSCLNFSAPHLSACFPLRPFRHSFFGFVLSRRRPGAGGFGFRISRFGFHLARRVKFITILSQFYHNFPRTWFALHASRGARAGGNRSRIISRAAQTCRPVPAPFQTRPRPARSWP
jgi:hypothetical protein